MPGIKFEDYEAPRDEAKKISAKIVKPHFIGPKSKEVQKQELISHIQNFQETFNNAQLKAWKNRFTELYGALT